MTDLLTSDFLKKFTASEDMSHKEFLLLEKTVSNAMAAFLNKSQDVTSKSLLFFEN